MKNFSVLILLFLPYLNACQANIGFEKMARNVSREFGNSHAQVREIDRFKSQRPGIICGKAGWNFMRKEFFDQNCGACHSGNFPAPYRFTSSDDDLAYQAALAVPRETMLSTSRANQFLEEEYHLSRDGEVYVGLLEWLTYARQCP